MLPTSKYPKWTEEDNAKLHEMAKLEVDIEDTSLDHAWSLNKHKLLNAVDTISKEKRVELRCRVAEISTSSNPKF